MKFFATAINAPTDKRPGAGTVSWEDGKIEGDPVALELAREVKRISPAPHQGIVDVDWKDPQHARAVFSQVLHEAYGYPVRFIEEADQGTSPIIEPGSTAA